MNCIYYNNYYVHALTISTYVDHRCPANQAIGVVVFASLVSVVVFPSHFV